jgi:DNA adenine methylase
MMSMQNPTEVVRLDGPNHRPELRPPLRWWGGKYYIAQKIISLFPPEYDRYVEPYSGAASVLLNKPLGEDYYNDLDKRLTRLFRVLRNHGDELVRRLQLTPYSEAEFWNCCEPDPAEADDIELARRDFIRWRMSRDGDGKNLASPTKRSRRGLTNNVAGYLSVIDHELPKIADRLRRVEILCRPALEVIRQLDGPTTLFYVDPPYPHMSRGKGATNVYAYEMSDDEHRELSAVLHSVEGKVLLSGYACTLYDELFSDWRLVHIPKKRDVGNGPKADAVECIWLNY